MMTAVKRAASSTEAADGRLSVPWDVTPFG
jgi:hypothetical protein